MGFLIVSMMLASGQLERWPKEKKEEPIDPSEEGVTAAAAINVYRRSIYSRSSNLCRPNQPESSVIKLTFYPGSALYKVLRFQIIRVK